MYVSKKKGLDGSCDCITEVLSLFFTGIACPLKKEWLSSANNFNNYYCLEKEMFEKEMLALLTTSTIVIVWKKKEMLLSVGEWVSETDYVVRGKNGQYNTSTAEISPNSSRSGCFI